MDRRRYTIAAGKLAVASEYIITYFVAAICYAAAAAAATVGSMALSQQPQDGHLTKVTGPRATCSNVLRSKLSQISKKLSGSRTEKVRGAAAGELAPAENHLEKFKQRPIKFLVGCISTCCPRQ